MTLTLTAVDPANPAHLDAYCQVAEAVRQHEWPRWRQTNPRTVRLTLDHPLPHVEHRYVLAWLDGEPVGRLNLELYTLENTDTMSADVWVVPSARRHAVGTRLWELVQETARANNRRKVLCTTSWELPGMPVNDFAGIRFAESLDFKPSLVDVTRRLELSTVDEGVLDKMSQPVPGYHTVTWTGLAPEEYLADLAYLEMRLHLDAPTGDLEVEAPKPNVERMRRMQAASAQRERVNYHSVAVHEESGKVVAWTLIQKDKSLDWNAFQQVTVVDPDHRGHRLGALVKAANLRFFREHEPAVTAIDTFNAHSNSYMIAINEQMGFRPLYAWQNWQREIL